MYRIFDKSKQILRHIRLIRTPNNRKKSIFRLAFAKHFVAQIYESNTSKFNSIEIIGY